MHHRHPKIRYISAKSLQVNKVSYWHFFSFWLIIIKSINKKI
jgi:hypothetical protein